MSLELGGGDHLRNLLVRTVRNTVRGFALLIN